MNWEKVGTLLARVRTPLALSGLVVVVLYGIYRQILGLDIFSKLGEQPTFQLITSIVDNLFWLALFAMVLGVASFILSRILKRRASSQVHLIDASLDERDSAYRATGDKNTGETSIRMPEQNKMGRTDHVLQIENTHRQFEFPTIDFKFQNTGDVAAVLWEFAVVIIDAVVDTAPVLSGRFLGPGVEETDLNRIYWDKLFDASRYLKVLVKNNGWGPAKYCDLIMTNNLLDRIFLDEERRFVGDIASEDEQVVLKLKPHPVDDKFFEDIKKLHADTFSNNDDRFRVYDVSDGDLPVGDVILRGTMTDITGKVTKVHETLKPPTNHGTLVLRRDGFLWREGMQHLGAPLYSDAIYPTIIDPELGSHTRTYPISRKIASGDVERFHIMVGATKSCRLKLKLRFRIDRDQTAESGIFNLEIWNPANARYHRRYPDGQEMQKEVVILRKKKQRGELGIDHEYYQLRHLEDDWEELMNVPFIKEKPRRR